jgi:uncharacterized repeat protein (TIGR03837 family)
VAHAKRWDIFCKIVDNYGDIGVCWRLAKQLSQEHGLTITLWVDDWVTAAKFIPALKSNANQSVVQEGITIAKWHATADFSTAAPVVIEAFACGLPSAYMQAMETVQSKWVNLEYLSAESWVEAFHANVSPQQGIKLTRHFYFPGFTEKTGGLIRESFLNNIAIEPVKIVANDTPEHALKISLFCYPHAPVEALFNTLATGPQNVICYVANGIQLPSQFDLLPLQTVDFLVPHLAQTKVHGNLTVQRLPFLSQAEYDALLQHCDLNFVRGEDSWLRAIWAEKPFIWQPYQQEAQAHTPKLEAFLAMFYKNADLSCLQAVQTMHHAWSKSVLDASIWQTYFSQLSRIKHETHLRVQSLKQQQDLGAKLVIFCNKI